jgi:hypothetical protein
MNVEIFTACDAATIRGGVLNILGCMELVFAKSFPARVPDIAIAMRIRFENHEIGDHKAEIRLVDSDGKNVIPPLIETISVHPRGLSRHSHIHVTELDGLPIPKQGEYSFDLLVNGEILARTPFFAAIPPPKK